MDNLKKGVDYIGVTVVFFCHDGKGNFLMGKRTQNARDEHGRWDIGGGGLELHDTVENTLRKEIKEEYCADVINFEFLGYRDVHREHQGHPTHWVSLDFKVLIDPSQVRNGEPNKFDEVKWFSLGSLPPQIELHSQLPGFIERYQAKLKGKVAAV